MTREELINTLKQLAADAEEQHPQAACILLALAGAMYAQDEDSLMQLVVAYVKTRLAEENARWN